MTRVLVCGGRNYADWRLVCKTLDELKPTVIIQGGATGADALADRWANMHGIERLRYPAAWRDLKAVPLVLRYNRFGLGHAYNAAAGTIRNAKMLAEGKPDIVVAFPGGKGTADMVAKARAANVPVLEVS